MDTGRTTRRFLTIAAMAMLTAGCVATFPVTSFFRSPDQVKGLVVDQDDKPVPDAELTFYEQEMSPIIIGVWPGHIFSRRRTAKTDESGIFALSFKRRDLRLTRIEKPGYVFEPTVPPKKWTRRYDPAQRNSPQNGKFLMYDIGGADQQAATLGSAQVFNIATDGTDYYLGLDAGKIAIARLADIHFANDFADLGFCIKQVGKKIFLLTIWALDGGVFGSRNGIPYAPREGYINGFSALYNNPVPHPTKYHFFARTRGGRYHSWIVAEIKNPWTIQFRYIVNKSGGRFLFAPKVVDRIRFQGPLDSIYDRDITDFAYVDFYDKQPWWSKQRYTYPILPENEFLESAARGVWKDYNLEHQLYAPYSILDELSHSPNRIVREELACNPALPREILLRLAGDPDENVRREAQKTLDRDLNLRAFLEERNYFRRSEAK